MSKKSRKSVQLYTFNSAEGKVDIDLNNFTAVCTVTDAPKQFHHSYLANLIESKYDNNITTFNETYVSRAGKAVQNEANASVVLEEKIDKLYAKIRELKAVRDNKVTA